MRAYTARHPLLSYETEQVRAKQHKAGKANPTTFSSIKIMLCLVFP